MHALLATALQIKNMDLHLQLYEANDSCMRQMIATCVLVLLLL